MADCDAGTLICLGQGLFFSYANSGGSAQTIAAITSLSWTIESNVTTTSTKYHEQKTTPTTSGDVTTDERTMYDAPVCTIEIAGAVLKDDKNALVELFEDAVKGQDCYPFEATDQCGASDLKGVAGNAYVSSFGLTGETDDIINWKATLVSVGELIEPGPPA